MKPSGAGFVGSCQIRESTRIVQERAFTEPTLVLRVVGESVDTKNKHETNLSFAGARACRQMPS